MATPLKIKHLAITAMAALTMGVSLSAQADITVGVSLSATGAAASLGIPQKNTVAIMPKTMGGHKVNYIVLDDASDTTAAVNNTRKLITENKVDIVFGSTITPNSLAMTDVVAEAHTPMIAFAANALIVEPVAGNKRWVFKTTQNDDLMSQAIVAHMAAAGIKKVAFIGFADAYGDGWFTEFSKAAQAQGIALTVQERFARNDTSVTGQILKIIKSKPDAVMIAASGTPAALPQKTLKERGYTGKIYQTHGAANADFLRVGGKDVNGAFLPAGPLLVASQLPDTHPVKKSALAYSDAYQAVYGANTVSLFGGHAWDASVLLAHAVPVALKTAQPGTAAFRAALRDALEQIQEQPGAHGIFSMSPTNHFGLDARSRVMVEIVNGGWQLR